MARFTRGQVGWTDTEIEKLRELRNSGVDLKTIGKELNKSPSACSNFIQRYADRYNIKTNRRGQHDSGFYNTYNGSVPYLHWSITKPWRISDDTKV